MKVDAKTFENKSNATIFLPTNNITITDKASHTTTTNVFGKVIIRHIDKGNNKEIEGTQRTIRKLVGEKISDITQTKEFNDGQSIIEGQNYDLDESPINLSENLKKKTKKKYSII